MRLSIVLYVYFLVIAFPINFEVASILFNGPRAVQLILFVPLAIRLFSGRVGKILPTDILLVLYLGWALLAMAVNSPERVVNIGGAYVLDMFGAYLLGRNFVRNAQEFRAFCRALFVLLLFTLPFAIYEALTGYAALRDVVSRIPGVFSYVDYSDGLHGRRLGLFRSQVIFSHPIHYGVVCSSLFALAFVGLKGTTGTVTRYLMSAAVFVATLASVSSGALLPLLLQVGLIFWGWLFRKVTARWIILGSLAVIGYVVVDVISNRTGIEVFLSYASLDRATAYGRILIFEWGVKSIGNNPFLGIGFNDWVRPRWLASSVDNFWLLVAMRYGVPALFLLALAYLWLIVQVARRPIQGGTFAAQYRLGWVISQIAIVLALCTVDVWEAALSFAFLLFGSGASFLTVSPQESATADRPRTSPSAETLAFTRFPGARAARATGAE